MAGPFHVDEIRLSITAGDSNLLTLSLPVTGNGLKTEELNVKTSFMVKTKPPKQNESRATETDRGNLVVKIETVTVVCETVGGREGNEAIDSHSGDSTAKPLVTGSPSHRLCTEPDPRPGSYFAKFSTNTVFPKRRLTFLEERTMQRETHQLSTRPDLRSRLFVVGSH